MNKEKQKLTFRELSSDECELFSIGVVTIAIAVTLMFLLSTLSSCHLEDTTIKACANSTSGFCVKKLEDL